MKYKYGVEYPCDGKKPELPDGVVVEQFYRNFWCFEAIKVEDWRSWDDVTKFRIVDERYKQKPEDKTWFERGEFPPVGARFEAYFERDDNPRWSAGVVSYKSDEHVILRFDDGDENYYEAKQLVSIGKFRPIRTEREKAIEAAISAMATKVISNVQRKTINRLYDAGLLRLPEGR